MKMQPAWHGCKGVRHQITREEAVGCRATITERVSFRINMEARG